VSAATAAAARINANPPALDPTLTTRARYAAHDKDPSCFGCHRLIDKVGFAFEDYDGVGRHRMTENGMPLDLSGELLNLDVQAPAFTGSQEFATMLSTSQQAASAASRRSGCASPTA